MDHTNALSSSRRHFLASAGSLAMAAAVGPVAHAIDPIKRAGPQKMQLSLAAYSMRKYLTAKPDAQGAMNMEGFVDYCKTLKPLDGAELTQYFFPKDTTDAYLDGLKQRCKQAGLAISGGAIGNNFTIAPGSKLDQQKEHTRTWIRNYGRLGAPAIRVFAGRPEKGVSDDEAIKRCVPVLEEMCEYAGKHGVKLALENHDFTTRVGPLMEIVKAVKSQWFGVNFDSGNFHSADPYKDMAAAAPYAINAQIKVEIRPAGQSKQPADLERVIKILRDADYSGWVVLEYEASEDPYKAIPDYLDTLHRLIG